MEKQTNKYSFVDFIAACESNNFDEVEETNRTWVKSFLKSYENVWNEEHSGDCTNQPHTCSFCLITEWLIDYKGYCANEAKWREENGI